MLPHFFYYMDKRQIATKYAWSYIGVPYKWGGDDFSSYDCSGLIVEILQAVGLIDRKTDYTAQGLYNKFKSKKRENPVEGCLVFWGKSDKKIIHIEYCINDELSIGASGGNSKTLTVEDAIRDNAYIKIRPFGSRKNIVGFVDPFSDL